MKPNVPTDPISECAARCASTRSCSIELALSQRAYSTLDQAHPLQNSGAMPLPDRAQGVLG